MANPRQAPVILSRAGFAGIQRYAAQWLGDNASDWDHLVMSLPMAMAWEFRVSRSSAPTSRLLGQPHARARRAMDAIRRDDAVLPLPQRGRRARSVSLVVRPGVEKAKARAALELRYRLLPYIYSAFVRASETGEPIQRPLVYDFQHDRHARETEDAYLFGDALLVRTGARAGTDGSSRVPASGNLGRLVHGRATPGRAVHHGLRAARQNSALRARRSDHSELRDGAALDHDHHPEAIDLHVVFRTKTVNSTHSSTRTTGSPTRSRRALFSHHVLPHAPARSDSHLGRRSPAAGFPSFAGACSASLSRARGGQAWSFEAATSE